MKPISLILVSLALTQADLTVDVIKKAGYPVDVHSVFTADQFKLRLHQIPKGIKKLHYNDKDSGEDNEKKGSVLVVHGLFSCSTQWVVGDPNKALPFMLADSGYDVWLFNARATSFSSYHKRYSSNTKEYWDFSWHEIATKDLPAVIDYIHGENGNETVRYIGHSQGGTVALVLLSLLPEYNLKLNSIYLIAPAAFLQNMSSLVTPLVQLSNYMYDLTNSMKIYGFIPGSPFSRSFLNSFCKYSSETVDTCTDFMFSTIGNNSGQLDKAEMLHIIPEYIANRISLKQVMHYAQISKSGYFRMFDHGSVTNQKRYGHKSPPQYNLSAVTTRTTIFYGTVDALVPPDGIHHLIAKLPNVKETVELPWNHLDVILGKDVDVRIHDKIIRSMINEANETQK